MESTKSSLIMIDLELKPGMAMPFYKQLAEKILCAWLSGQVKSGELLPSLHELSSVAKVSRHTAEKAYDELKSAGLISSYKGKGFFIREEDGLSLLDVLRAMKQHHHIKPGTFNL